MPDDESANEKMDVAGEEDAKLHVPKAEQYKNILSPNLLKDTEKDISLSQIELLRKMLENQVTSQFTLNFDQ